MANLINYRLYNGDFAASTSWIAKFVFDKKLTNIVDARARRNLGPGNLSVLTKFDLNFDYSMGQLDLSIVTTNISGDTLVVRVATVPTPTNPKESFLMGVEQFFFELKFGTLQSHFYHVKMGVNNPQITPRQITSTVANLNTTGTTVFNGTAMGITPPILGASQFWLRRNSLGTVYATGLKTGAPRQGAVLPNALYPNFADPTTLVPYYPNPYVQQFGNVGTARLAVNNPTIQVFATYSYGDPMVSTLWGDKYKLPSDVDNFCYYDNWDPKNLHKPRLTVNTKLEKSINGGFVNKYLYINYSETVGKKRIHYQLLFDFGVFGFLKLNILDRINKDLPYRAKLNILTHDNIRKNFNDKVIVRNVNYGDGKTYKEMIIDSHNQGLLRFIFRKELRMFVLPDGISQMALQDGGWGCMFHKKYSQPRFRLHRLNYVMKTVDFLPEFDITQDLLRSDDFTKLVKAHFDKHNIPTKRESAIPKKITYLIDNGKLYNIEITPCANKKSMNAVHRRISKNRIQDQIIEFKSATGDYLIGPISQQEYVLALDSAKRAPDKKYQIEKREKALQDRKENILRRIRDTNPLPEIKEKIFLFLLVPPHQGSTVLYKLLSTSPNISTLINAKPTNFTQPIWAGEGQALLRAENFSGFTRLPGDVKSKKNYKKFKNSSRKWIQEGIRNQNMGKTLVDFHQMLSIYSQHWNLDKEILCEKSPSLISLAKKYENYFSKYGKVYFISMIRNPYCVKDIHYSTKEWVRYAKTLLRLKDRLQNNLFMTYEEFTDNLPVAKEKILNFLPQLGDLDINVEKVDGITTERANPITNKNEIYNVEWKNLVLHTNQQLLEQFGYHLIRPAKPESYEIFHQISKKLDTVLEPSKVLDELISEQDTVGSDDVLDTILDTVSDTVSIDSDTMSAESITESDVFQIAIPSIDKIKRIIPDSGDQNALQKLKDTITRIQDRIDNHPMKDDPEIAPKIQEYSDKLTAFKSLCDSGTKE